MRQSDVVIIGGSAAGVTAAITARRHHPNKKVLLIRKEQQVMIPCGIPYIFGTLGSPEKNLIPDGLLDKSGIDLLVAEASAIDRRKKAVATSAGEVAYDRLILATGSAPARPPIPGIDLEGVFEIRKDSDYLRRLQECLAEARNVAIIGGGFIGIEFADEINKGGGKNVTVIEIAPSCLSLASDLEFCTEMEQHLISRGVAVRTSSTVSRIIGDGHVAGVQLKDGTQVKADVVILGIGARANTALATKSGLTIGPTGGVAVDRAMRTSDEAIFACGDCAEKISFFGGRPSPLKLASIATLEARIAGANLFGLRRESDGTVGVWSTAVGELALGTAGLTESAARQLGYQVVSAEVEGPNRHPGGIPGGAPMKIKLIFEASSRAILGGQVRGNGSTGEMINAIAACVQKRMTAEDIAMFQMGTHPALTASPIAYPLVNAAEMAIMSF